MGPVLHLDQSKYCPYRGELRLTPSSAMKPKTNPRTKDVLTPLRGNARPVNPSAPMPPDPVHGGNSLECAHYIAQIAQPGSGEEIVDEGQRDAHALCVRRVAVPAGYRIEPHDPVDATGEDVRSGVQQVGVAAVPPAGT